MGGGGKFLWSKRGNRHGAADEGLLTEERQGDERIFNQGCDKDRKKARICQYRTDRKKLTESHDGIEDDQSNTL